jgi:hypothetical protein
MRPRSRTRRILKWAGVVACAAVGVTWLSKFSVNLFRVGETWVWLERGFHLPCRGEFHSILSYDNGYSIQDGPSYSYIGIPFWVPLVVAAIPTAILWCLDRRPLEGHCRKCGYDLTGNVTGVCPECGKPT